MERKTYLIFSDSVDAVCEIKGYIRGTEEEARAYCNGLNRNQENSAKEFVWMEIPLLPTTKLWKMKMDPRFTTVPKIAEKWGVSKAYVYHLCQKNRIPGVIFEKDHWCIPVDAEKPTVKKQGFLSALQMAKKWDVPVNSVLRLCTLGLVPGAERDNSTWSIPEDAVYPLEGYISIPQLAEKWGMSRVPVSKLCKEGRISGALRVGRDWYAPVDAERPADERKERKPGYLSATRTAEKWGSNRQYVCKMCREGRVPGAEHIGGYWYIPEDAERPADGRRKRRE